MTKHNDLKESVQNLMANGGNVLSEEVDSTNKHGTLKPTPRKWVVSKGGSQSTVIHPHEESHLLDTFNAGYGKYSQDSRTLGTYSGETSTYHDPSKEDRIIKIHHGSHWDQEHGIPTKIEVSGDHAKNEIHRVLGTHIHGAAKHDGSYW